MKMTRERLGQIIREEAARLREAPRPKSNRGPNRGPKFTNKDPQSSWYQPEEPTEIGSYEAVEAGEQLRRFSEAVAEYAELITAGVISGAPSTTVRSSMRTLKDELKNVGTKLNELATKWDKLIVGPDDETDEPRRPSRR